MVSYYNEIKCDDGIIYSLDMVRLKVDFGNKLDAFYKWIMHLADYDLKIDVKYFQNMSNFKYKYLYSLDIRDNDNDCCTFSIGVNFNGSNEPTVGFFEFNPNKCFNCLHFHDFWNYLINNYIVDTEVIRYDLAIDIPLSRRFCRLVKENKKTYSLITKDDGVTEYLGVRNKNGFIKLYDKTRESDLDYSLTRLEITLDAKQDLSLIFPKVYIFDSQESFVLSDNLSQNDVVLINLLRAVDNFSIYFNQLTSRKRKKIEPYLANKILSINDSAFNSIKQQALSFELY